MSPKHRKPRLGRRAFLGGAGVAIALPFLPSLGFRRARAQEAEQCEAPRRMLAYYVPCGIHMQSFTPATTGADYALTPILEPLSALKDDILVLTGLESAAGKSGGDGPGDHARGTGVFLTATRVNKSESDIRNGISVDQVAANAIGGCTRLPSLQLGIDGGGNSGGCDSGYSCAYARNISWADERTPMPKLTRPQAVFDRLFDGFDPGASAAEVARRRAYRQSVLDSVLGDISSLNSRLGQTDQRKLDEYLSGVRQLETRIADDDGGAVCEVPERPPGNYDLNEHVDLMNELMVLAFRCDLTRVTTFMLANAGSGRSYGFLGVGDGHHAVSHHQNSQENFRKITTINIWEVERFARLVQRLKDTEDVDGSSLLQNTTVMFGSEISDGNRHNHDNMPVIMAGQGGGAFRTGRHVRYDGDPPVANLYVSMLQATGVQANRFGADSTGPLPDLA